MRTTAIRHYFLSLTKTFEPTPHILSKTLINDGNDQQSAVVVLLKMSIISFTLTHRALSVIEEGLCELAALLKDQR